MDPKLDNCLNSLHLIREIANKNNDLETAKGAFVLFVGLYEDKVKKYAEIQAGKLGYDDNVAFEAAQCTFNKVWLYPTFDMKKAHFKDGNKAVEAWLFAIVLSQMHQFSKMGVCAQITEDEDLSVIETAKDFVDFHNTDLPFEHKLELIKYLDTKLSVLDEKHRIIYLTYKAYHTRGKKLPRTLLSKLRTRLGLTQVTIRVYKREACIAINDKELMES